MAESVSNKNLLQNTGKMMLSGGNGASLSELLPDSWINNKYMTLKPKGQFEDTLNDRQSEGSRISSKTYSRLSKE